MNAYDFTARTLEGQEAPLSAYRGRAMLIVNTASKCGFTPQYEGLEALHRKFGDRGLTVVGFPCNQFGGQEPGSNKEIATFCALNYGVGFPMMAKIEVNGPRTDPLFVWLKQQRRGILGTPAIKWNFTKFLIDRQGHAVARYAPATKPNSLETAIEAALQDG